MIRRLAPWFGAFTLTLVGGFLAVFGPAAVANPGTAIGLVGLAVAAILSIVGGFVDSLEIGSRTVPWNVLLGSADIVLAIAIGLSALLTAGSGGTEGRLVTGAFLVGTASLGWFGVQTARDSRHVDLEASPAPARVVGIVALAAVSIAGGAAVATTV